jgi:hypothetical protein
LYQSERTRSKKGRVVEKAKRGETNINRSAIYPGFLTG